MSRGLFAVAVACSLLLSAGGRAEPAAKPVPAESLVLTLSWSPTWCASRAGQKDQEQCGATKYGFVVHGLWPQYAKGARPKTCPEVDEVPAKVAEQMLPLMPSRKLINHEWKRHGACMAADAQSYFGRAKAAADKVKIPASLASADKPRTLTADQIRKAFVDANPGLPATGVAVTCRTPRGPEAAGKLPSLNDVRICLDNGLKFQECPGSVRDRCDGAAMLPVVK